MNDLVNDSLINDRLSEWLTYMYEWQIMTDDSHRNEVLSEWPIYK